MRSTATATATGAAVIIRDMYLQSGAGFTDVLGVITTPSSSARCSAPLSSAWAHALSSALPSSAYHTNTNAKVELANGIISYTLCDTLCAYANCRKDAGVVLGRPGQSSHVSRIRYKQYSLDT